jgi:hypothetical protein
MIDPKTILKEKQREGTVATLVDFEDIDNLIVKATDLY